MKRFLFILLILAGAAPLFAQEGYSITRVVFLPPTFYVGDRVELRLRVKPDPGVNLAPPQNLPQLNWIEIEDASLIRGESESEFRIAFSTFQPGTRSLPAIPLGDIVLEDIKIHTASVLDSEKNVLAPLRDQLYLPGTRLYIVLAVAFLILLPLGLIPLVKFLTEKVSQTLDKSREGRVFRRLKKEIHNIQDRMDSLDSRKFYIMLTESLRKYLSKKTGKDFITTTSREIRTLLKTSLPDRKIQRDVLKVFTSGDKVKFGGSSAGIKSRTHDLSLVMESAEKIEEHYTGHREADRVDS